MKERLLQFIESKRIPVYKFEEKTGLSRGYIKNMREGIGAKKLEGILKSFPELNRVWLLTGEGEMLNKASIINYLNESTEAYESPNRTIPYYPVDFEGGFDIMVNDQTTVPDHFVSLPNISRRATCCCHLTGHSMEPLIANGDIIVLERIEDLSWLPLGEIYAIVTTNGMRTVKRLMRADDDTCYRLQPVNPDYPEQDIPKDLIQHAFLILAVYKTL